MSSCAYTFRVPGLVFNTRYGWSHSRKIFVALNFLYQSRRSSYGRPYDVNLPLPLSPNRQRVPCLPRPTAFVPAVCNAMRGSGVLQLWCGLVVCISLVQFAAAQTEVEPNDIGIGWESTLFAGSGVPAYRDDVGKESHFSFMQSTKWLVGIDLDPAGQFALVADQYNQAVRMLNISTARVTTIVKMDDSAERTVIGWTRANSVKGVSISQDGSRAVVANSYNATTKLNNDQMFIWINTRTGTWTPVRNLTDDSGGSIMPWAVAMNGNEEVYSTNNALSIVKVNLNTGRGTHLVGQKGTGVATKGYVDGIGTNAFFEHPMGLALDRSSPPRYLYVTDQLAVIRRVDLTTNMLTTIAGPRPGEALVNNQVPRSFLAPACPPLPLTFPPSLPGCA
eukprot:3258351-Rhodomonas_salina.1